MTARPEYEDIEVWSREAIQRALDSNEPEGLSRAVLAVTFHDQDWRYAQELCVRLSGHRHEIVRGNAVLGFGHIARTHRKLDRQIVRPIIARALKDKEGYVRRQAQAAKDDTEHFLGWKYEKA
jgi:hypothetical protein